MNIRHLEMLLAVVERGGYKAAGDHLHLSHSAVHRQVKLLEEDLGERVLVRQGRRVHLTPCGELLVETARRIQEELARAKARISESASLDAGHLRIGTGTGILNYFLPSVLEQFQTRYPRVEVTVITGTGRYVLQEIRNGTIDLGLIYSSATPPPDGGPHHEYLYEDEFVLGVGKKHPLAAMRSVKLADALKYPFIHYPPPSHLRQFLDHLFHRASVHPRIVMELENEEAMEKMIGINMGIAFLSCHRAESDRIRHLRLTGFKVLCPVVLVTSRADYLPAPAREFARVCRTAIKTKTDET